MKRKSDFFWGKLSIYAGVLALLISAGIYVYNIWDETRAADTTARVTQILFEQIEDNKKSYDPGTTPLFTGKAEDEIPLEQPEDHIDFVSVNAPLFIELNGEKYIGILSIPALLLELPINNHWNESKLKNTPCRYAGDLNASLVIAGHNYKNHFGSLSKLVKGDTVTLTDAVGAKYLYVVEKVVPVAATDIDAMLDGSYGLTLFTCNYSGMARVAVRCARQNP